MPINFTCLTNLYLPLTSIYNEIDNLLHKITITTSIVMNNLRIYLALSTHDA